MHAYTLHVDSKLTIKEVRDILKQKREIALDGDVWVGVERSHLLLKRIVEDGKPVYGINTGFGSLCSVSIPPEELQRLQLNVIISHGQGMGNFLPYEVCRLALLYKIKGLSRGYSGVSPSLLERLIKMYNLDIIPAMPEFGSVGASGDLVPLAHMSLPLLGKGYVWYKNRIMCACDIVPPDLIYRELQPKEGLALVNGTEVSSALMTYAILELERLFWNMIFAAHLSCVGAGSKQSPFSPHINNLKGHRGQKHISLVLRKLVSLHRYRESDVIQEPYSFRCIPQIYGPLLDSLWFAISNLENEINGVSDNPIFVSEENVVLSGGNFHGEYIGQSCDFLKISVAKCLISGERRIKHLMGGINDLPVFLTPEPGLNSGFMAYHYVCAHLLNKVIAIASPSSIHNVPTCNDQEDVVSMSPSCASSLIDIINLGKKITGIEILCAWQSIKLKNQNIELNKDIQDMMETHLRNFPRDSDPTLESLSFQVESALTYLYDDIYELCKKIFTEREFDILNLHHDKENN